MLDALINGFYILLRLNTLLLLSFGTIIGIIVGAIPGIGPTLGIALAIPFTFGLSPENALILLISIYGGAMYGGAISSILINTPGTGSAAATTLEGYPMAKKGEAMFALALSALSSGFGGILAGILVIFFTLFLVKFVLLFATPEKFMLALFGICLIIVITTKGNLIKGLISATFGLLITAVGIAPMTADVRYTFMRPDFYDGLGYLPALIGLFAVAEVFRLSGIKQASIAERIDVSGRGRMDAFKEILRNFKTFIKSVFIGIFIGSIPGAGGSVSNFLAYAEARRVSKNPELWGKGNPEGIIASESSNNATVSGALIPTLTFGIPGSATTAALLGGLLLHGLRPGIKMFTGEGLNITYSIFLAVIFSHILILFLGLTLIRPAGKIVLIKKEHVMSIVIILAVLGIFSMQQNYFDIYQIVIFGVIGYIFNKYKYPVIPAIISIILGRMIESNLFRSLRLSGGSFSIFLQRPISLILLLGTILVLFSPFLSRYGKKLKNKKSCKKRA